MEEVSIPLEKYYAILMNLAKKSCTTRHIEDAIMSEKTLIEFQQLAIDQAIELSIQKIVRAGGDAKKANIAIREGLGTTSDRFYAITKGAERRGDAIIIISEAAVDTVKESLEVITVFEVEEISRLLNLV